MRLPLHGFNSGAAAAASGCRRQRFRDH